MTMTRRLAGWLAAAALATGLAALPAAAATCSTANLTTSTACVAGIAGGPGGNVTTAEMNAGAGVFGIKPWEDLGKINTTDGGGTYPSAFFTFTSNADNSSGTWKLNDGLAFAPGAAYALVLKGAQSNVAYLLDTAFTSGTWSNADLKTPSGRLAGLSNATLFGTAAPIPLPAAAWLLLGGIAGLGALKRRSRAAA